MHHELLSQLPMVIAFVVVVIALVVFLKHKFKKRGVILEKKYMPSSRFMAFQYRVDLLDKDGFKTGNKIWTPVLMTEYDEGRTIVF